MYNIPKKIHQTWKSKNIPENYKNLVDSWKNKHPSWEYNLYDDQDCINFIKNYHPNLLHGYLILKEPVMKADMFRYLILYQFGGLYTDLDTEALKPFDSLLDGDYKMVIGIELDFDKTSFSKMAPVYNDFYKKNNLNRQYIQYCFLSAPQNPILLEIAIEIARNADKQLHPIKQVNTIIKTGPGIYSKIIQKYIDKGYPVKVLDTKYLSGIESTIQHYLLGINNPSKDSYVKHHEMASWRDKNDIIYTLMACVVLCLFITVIVFFIYGIVYYFKCKKKRGRCLNIKTYCKIKKILLIISVILIVIIFGLLINFAIQDRAYWPF